MVNAEEVGVQNPYQPRVLAVMTTTILTGSRSLAPGQGSRVLQRSLKNTLIAKTPTRSITSREDNIKLTSPIPQDCLRENKIFERNI